MAKSGFTVIPNKIFDMELKATSFKVLIFIFKWKHGKHSNMSLTFIENGTSISRNTIIKAIRELESKRCILVNRKGNINTIMPNLPFFETQSGITLKKREAKLNAKTKKMATVEDMFGPLALR